MATPELHPRTEADLYSAARDGFLEETRFLDLKAQLNSGSAANKELARDLAQFAIDSGSLVIGVTEKPDSTPHLTPVVVAGLAERVEQIARTIPDPPLAVTCTAIPSAADPTKGYLWIHVPASGIGPHMVGGIYYGRGDKTRYKLSDADVRRYHRLLEASDDQIGDELDHYIGRDPVLPGERQHAHLFIVAVPTTPRAGMLLDLLDSPVRYHVPSELVFRGASAVTANFFPSIANINGTSDARSDGIAFCYGLDKARALTWDAHVGEDALEVEISEEATIRVMTTRFSDDIAGEEKLFEIMLPTLVRQTVGIAAEFAAHASYGGGWRLGVAATGIAGLTAYVGNRWGVGHHVVGADQDEYRQITGCSTTELRDHPHEVANRLAGRFVRSLDLSNDDLMRELLSRPAAD